VKHIFGPTQGGRQKNHYGLYVFFIFQKIYLCQLLVDFLFCFHKFVFQVLKTKSALLTFLIFFFLKGNHTKKMSFYLCNFIYSMNGNEFQQYNN
jgi:hypothetical protein